MGWAPQKSAGNKCTKCHQYKASSDEGGRDLQIERRPTHGGHGMNTKRLENELLKHAKGGSHRLPCPSVVRPWEKMSFILYVPGQMQPPQVHKLEPARYRALRNA